MRQMKEWYPVHGSRFGRHTCIPKATRPPPPAMKWHNDWVNGIYVSFSRNLFWGPNDHKITFLSSIGGENDDHTIKLKNIPRRDWKVIPTIGDNSDEAVAKKLYDGLFPEFTRAAYNESLSRHFNRGNDKNIMYVACLYGLLPLVKELLIEHEFKNDASCVVNPDGSEYTPMDMCDPQRPGRILPTSELKKLREVLESDYVPEPEKTDQSVELADQSREVDWSTEMDPLE